MGGLLAVAIMKFRNMDEWDISRCAVLALLLEVSAYPKPGNVSRRHDFAGTKYEHFLASAVALSPVFYEAARFGMRDETSGKIGLLVKRGVEESMRWQSGGNTHFGSILLLVPLAMAAGFVERVQGIADAEEEAVKKKRAGEIQRKATEIVRRSTVEDAVLLYEAFPKAKVRVPPVEYLDVRDPTSLKEIRKRGLTLHDILSISAAYDKISAEIVEGFPRTFRYADMLLQMRSQHTVCEAISYAYLHLLAAEEDTFVRMKCGEEASKYVRERAYSILKRRAWRELEAFDDELVERGINPGSTADVIAAAIFVALLCGFEV